VLNELININQINNQQLEASVEGDGHDPVQASVEPEAPDPQEAAMLAGFRLGIPYVDLTLYNIQPEAIRLIPESLARKYNVIPLAIINNALQVAMADAGDVLTLEALAAQTQMKIELAIATVDEIRAAIDRNYKAYSEIESELNRAASSLPVTEDRVSAETIAGAPVVRALDLIIDEAIKDRASDIHIEPEEDRLYLQVLMLPLSPG